MKAINYKKIIVLLTLLRTITSKNGMFISLFILFNSIISILFCVYNHDFRILDILIIILSYLLTWECFLKKLQSSLEFERIYLSDYIIKLKHRYLIYK